MPFYEVIFETGAHSIMSCADDAEVVSFATAHQERAKVGLPGGPAGQPAERISRILKYDSHPADYNPDQTVSKEVLKEEWDKLYKDMPAVVSLGEVASAIRDLSNPVVVSPPHESNYKMEEAGEVKWPS